jgi:hypothetical protein
MGKRRRVDGLVTVADEGPPEDPREAEAARERAKGHVRREFEKFKRQVAGDARLSPAKRLLQIQDGRRARDRLLREPGLRLEDDPEARPST